MKFVRLSVGGGMEFRVGDCDRPETRNRRHERLFFQRVDAVLTRINKDRALRPRSPKRGGNEHSGKNEAAERVHVSTYRNRDRLSGHGGALGQVGSETDGLTVMTGARGIGQLRSFRR